MAIVFAHRKINPKKNGISLTFLDDAIIADDKKTVGVAWMHVQC